jgi:DNA polymerase-4
MGYYAQVLTFAARFENGLRVEGSEHCFRAQDSLTFIHMLDNIWQRALSHAQAQGRGGNMRIRKVSMALHGLVAADVAQQPELIPALQEHELRQRIRAERMSQALDRINHRFGRDSVTLGMMPSEGRSVSGTKVAFTCIPDEEEFFE